MIRHPEKLNKNNPTILKKPSWLKVKAPTSKSYFETLDIVNSHNLHTVCQEAACPNIGECWDKKHATFMILGDTCTRACAFCNVKTGKPSGPPNQLEPLNVAKSVMKLGLKHVVITSVDRDDLKDGGASQFIETIKYIRELSPLTTIEILTPDFLRKDKNYIDIAKNKPDVFNHNVETIPRLYKSIRPGSIYKESLNLLLEVKNFDNKIFTKSGIMVGLGENFNEIKSVLKDMKKSLIDFVTIGQYLQPSIHHEKVHKFYSPDEFSELYEYCKFLNFKMISSSAMTRSSYHADEDFEKLRQIA
ncbi:MAG: lipoyl synthase [Pelagibacteraceae bacterium]|nr:lipoyl synthase [Pelagibacteraceae bacterium]|tara:strand:- start:83 stop:991 length:909 start_codon:yes stop_codon:yes gene_type:complete